MIEWVTGNIWDYHEQGNVIVIPTNAGWTKDGSNVMGRGLAKQAKERYPALPKIYGHSCRDGVPMKYYEQIRLIMVPTKPLLHNTPWLSWRAKSDIDTICKSLLFIEQVSEIIDKIIYIPLLGAGNGKLEREEVEHTINTLLNTNKIIGVH